MEWGVIYCLLNEFSINLGYSAEVKLITTKNEYQCLLELLHGVWLSPPNGFFVTLWEKLVLQTLLMANLRIRDYYYIHVSASRHKILWWHILSTGEPILDYLLLWIYTEIISAEVTSWRLWFLDLQCSNFKYLWKPRQLPGDFFLLKTEVQWAHSLYWRRFWHIGNTAGS